MRLSPNFTTAEFLKSPTGDRLGIDNYHYTNTQLGNMRRLCEKCLEVIRAKLREKTKSVLTVQVTSGLRSPALNKAVGGAANSQHLRGQAADIVVPGMTVQELFDFILEEGIVFDQMIQEFDAWVHISWRNGGPAYQRQQSMYAWKNAQGKTVYTTKRPIAMDFDTQQAPLT